MKGVRQKLIMSFGTAPSLLYIILLVLIRDIRNWVSGGIIKYLLEFFIFRWINKIIFQISTNNFLKKETYLKYFSHRKLSLSEGERNEKSHHFSIVEHGYFPFV